MSKNIIEQILNENIRDKQIKSAFIPKTEYNNILWKVNSLREFTKRSYLIQQLYENNIERIQNISSRREIQKRGRNTNIKKIKM